MEENVNLQINMVSTTHSNNTHSPIYSIHNLDSPSSYTQSLSFLIRIYQSIFKLSNEKVDFYTINQITHFPLIICEKIVNLMTSKQRKVLTQDEFTSFFNTLYFGSVLDKARLIAMLCDFKLKENIHINDVKLLLLHFHMRVLRDDTENIILDIVDTFFDRRDTLTIEEFLHQSFEKNYDIIHIFIMFFEKFRFFNNAQLKFFEEVQMKMMYKSFKSSNKKKKNANSSNVATFNTMLSTTITSSNNLFIPQINNTCSVGSITKLNLLNNKVNPAFNFSLVPFNIESSNPEAITSSKAIKYDEMVQGVSLEVNAFDEDNEMRTLMEKYDSDYEKMISNFQRQSRFNESNKAIVDINSFGSEFSPTARSTGEVKGIDEKKGLKNFFFWKFYQHLGLKNKLNAYDDTMNFLKENFTINQLPGKKEEKVEKKEIICYKLNKKMNKFKNVKLVIFSNMIFYYSINHKTSNFIFKKIIFIEQLYPKEVKMPFLPVNVPLPAKSPLGTVFQVQITSALHNNQIVSDYYSASEEELSQFAAYISKVQNLRPIDSIYEMGEELGHGRFGKVILATHRLTGEKVSIKTVSKYEKEHSEENFHCSQWEKDIFQFLSHITHKNVEQCFEYFETPNYLYYVNEYISGGDLKNLIVNNSIGKAKTIKYINELTRQLIKGLHCLHKYGIIHRDVKHTNTLVAIDSKKNVELKIIDFGLSKVMGFDEYASEHYGSLSFKAPELINGTKYSFNVDVWALGVTVFFILYGTYPVKAENKHLLKKKIVNFNFDFSQTIQFGNINDYMNKIMIKCFIKDPKKRPSIFVLNKIKLNYDEYEDY